MNNLNIGGERSSPSLVENRGNQIKPKQPEELGNFTDRTNSMPSSLPISSKEDTKPIKGNIEPEINVESSRNLLNLNNYATISNDALKCAFLSIDPRTRLAYQ